MIPIDADAPELGQRPLVDLHAHILPGIDDGARDEAQALAMLRVAREDGVKTIVATPHAHHVRTVDIVAITARLNESAARSGIDVEVLPGMETRIGPGIVERWQADQPVTLNGTRWLLLELYLGDDWPWKLIEHSFDRLIDAGLWPILAHAERYELVQREPVRVRDLVKRGVPIQINAGSLSGYHGRVAQETAETLLKRRLGHVIASDAHNHERRAPRLRAAFNRAATLAGPSYASWMADAADAVVAGCPIPLPTP